MNGQPLIGFNDIATIAPRLVDMNASRSPEPAITGILRRIYHGFISAGLHPQSPVIYSVGRVIQALEARIPQLSSTVGASGYGVHGSATGGYGQGGYTAYMVDTRNVTDTGLDERILDKAISDRETQIGRLEDQIKALTTDATSPPASATLESLEGALQQRKDSLQRLITTRRTWDTPENRPTGQPNALTPRNPLTPVGDAFQTTQIPAGGQTGRRHVDLDSDGIRWGSPRRSSEYDNGTPVPDHRRSCVSVAIITLAEPDR